MIFRTYKKASYTNCTKEMKNMKKTSFVNIVSRPVRWKVRTTHTTVLLSISMWLRPCATSRTVPGSIPGGVTGFFNDIFPSDQTMALGSTQPLVKMTTRNISGGKGGRCVRLTTYHHTVPLSRNLGALTS